jgi:hypothetical protein
MRNRGVVHGYLKKQCKYCEYGGVGVSCAGNELDQSIYARQGRLRHRSEVRVLLDARDDGTVCVLNERYCAIGAESGLSLKN